MWKKIMVLTAVAMFLFAPLANAAVNAWDGFSSADSIQLVGRDMSSDRDMDRDKGFDYGYDHDNVYPEKSPWANPRYDRDFGDVGSGSRPTLRGGEGSR